MAFISGIRKEMNEKLLFVKKHINLKNSFVSVVFVCFFAVGSAWGQINYSFNFDANATGWTGDFARFTTSTACGGSGGSMRRNLYSTQTTGQLISPLVGTSNGMSATVSYSYKAAVWIANNAAQANWGTFDVQYGSTATGPWTTFATITNETQLGNACISKSHNVTLPVGNIFIRFRPTWQSGDYYLNFDNIVVTQVAATPCVGTPNAGTAAITLSSGCTGQSFTLSATGLSTGTGITYQWQSSPTGLAGSWSNIVGANASILTTSTTSNTYYQLITTCSNSSSSATSNSVIYTIAGNTCTCGTYPSNFALYTYDEDITNVTVGTMNNPSTCATLAPGSGSILNSYSNYTGSVTGPSAMQGDVLPFSLTMTTCSDDFSNFFQIYVDWNQNGSFLDAGDQVYSQAASVIGNQIVTGSFPVPLTATLGTTRMRIVNIEAIASTSNYAQSTPFSWGETEDYCFTVTAAVACSGTPNSGSAAISSASSCPGVNFTLSASGLTTGTGITYQWQSSPTGAAPWTDIVGANASTLTTSTTSTMYYRLFTTCSNSGQSNTTDVVSYTLVGDACTCSSYCIPTQSGTSNITNVTINTLNNTTSSASPYYSFQSATTTLLIGNSYTLSVIADASSIYSVWFDWNGNGVFEASEWTQLATTSTFASVNITVPANAVSNVRMRIRTRNNGNANGSGDACSIFFSGETQDYCISVVAPTNCSVNNNSCASTCYPVVYATNRNDADISNVTIGSLNNSSTCDLLAPGVGSVPGRYSNYTSSLLGPSEMLGSTVNFSLTNDCFVNNNAGTLFAFFQIYIDWNQDGDFGDAGEMLYQTASGGGVAANSTFTGSFVVPLTALLGTTRMRVVHCTFTNTNYNTSSNYAQLVEYNKGETEDYCFTVTAAVACSGTPNSGSAAISSASSCPGVNFTLSASGLTAGTGITYQWQSAPTASGPWTDIVGANASFLSTSATSTTYYQLITTCINSGFSAASDPVNYNVLFTNACCNSFKAALIGNQTICSGVQANLTFTPINGAAPYSLIYKPTGGINTTVNNLTAGSTISVSPATSTSYEVVSVTDAYGCVWDGNWVENPNGSNGLNAWTIELNGGDGWSTVSDPCFVTSFGTALKSQIIDLSSLGYPTSELDAIPEVYFKDDYASFCSYAGCTAVATTIDVYGCRIELQNNLNNPLSGFANPISNTIFNISNFSSVNSFYPSWVTTSNTFNNYPAGLRKVKIQHGGEDGEFWLGHYGIRIKGTTLKVLPKITVNQNPSLIFLSPP